MQARPKKDQDFDIEKEEEEGLPSLALAMNTINSTIKMRALTRVKFLS